MSKNQAVIQTNMYKFFTNLNLRRLIILAILFFSALIFSITILFLSIKVSKNSRDDSKTIVNQYTARYALKIEGLLNETISITRTLADVLADNPDSDLENLNPINSAIIQNALSKNPDFLQVWFDWDIRLVKPDYPKVFGRVGSVVYKDTGGRFYFDRHLKDTVDIEPQNDYVFTKKTHREMVGEPYVDALSKNYSGIMMVSPTAPMIVNGKFLGWAGVDLDMRHIQRIVKDVRPYEQSLAYLVSPGKRIVAQNDEKFHDKDIFEVNSKYKMLFSGALEQTGKEKNASFVYENDKKEDVYVSMYPIIIGRDKEIWTLTTETPLNEIVAESRSMFYFILIAGFIGIIILCVIVYFILDNIFSKLRQAVAYSGEIADGNLRGRLEFPGKNEIAVLGNSLNKMSDKLKNIISQVHSISETINKSSVEIDLSSDEISETSSNQAASIEEVMASIEEMNANIQSNAENARETEIIAQKALSGITTGSKSLKQTVDAILTITNNISIISEISHQTNILALNAAVEAARAGSQGKGFAVVANEVKKLAEKSQSAASQITKLSADGVNISNLAEKELLGLLPEIEKTALLIKDIAVASSEQSNGAHQVQNVIQELNSIAQKNAMHSEQLNIKAKNLLEQAENLKQIINYFTI